MEGTDEPVLTFAPYHLRLDWLLRFAALSSYEEQPWFAPFLRKLLEGDRPVFSLLRTNPFPDRPPGYVRALVYEYHLSSPGERAVTAQWWTRKLVHCRLRGPVGIAEGRLTIGLQVANLPHGFRKLMDRETR